MQMPKASRVNGTKNNKSIKPKTKMKKIILSIALLSGIVCFSQGSTAIGTQITPVVSNAITLQEGTIVKITLNEDLNGKKLDVGQRINFTTNDEVIINNRVVIPVGLKVTGTVTEASASGMLAKRGKLSFSIDRLYLNDGRIINLTNDVKKQVKSSTGVVVATAVLISPLALFIGGKNAKYEKGTPFEAYLKEDFTF